jgi:hypothetical protein
MKFYIKKFFSEVTGEIIHLVLIGQLRRTYSFEYEEPFSFENVGICICACTHEKGRERGRILQEGANDFIL